MTAVIIEDHLMFREVLHKICTELELNVVGEAEDGEMAIELVTRLQPGLVLLDLHLPNIDGFGVLDAIRKLDKVIRVLVLSSHCDEYTVFRAESARIQGFVDRNSNSIGTLKTALREVIEGRNWYSEAFRRARAERLRTPQSFDKMLTSRERAVLALIGQPLRDAEIAERLGISIETVEKHRFNILRKLGIEKTAELARYAREHGFTLTARQDGDGALLP